MSYATIEEADSYVTSSFSISDNKRIEWESLDEDSKQILLNKSMTVIDNLPLAGRKHSCTQPNAFPRNCDTEVPNAVKYAEIELALELSSGSVSAKMDEYRQLINAGVSSYTIGDFSETFYSAAMNTLQVKYGLVSTQAEVFLAPWLTGGYAIV